jgi:hypothetical protein
MKDRAMRLLTILVLATLSLMGALVARDNSYQAEPSGRDVTQADAFLKTERGQDLKRLADILQSGDEETFNREYEVYRQKYNAPPMGSSYPGAEEPSPRNSTPNMGAPMQLPLGAR